MNIAGRFIFIALLVFLSGCQTVKNLHSFLPREHDPALASSFVETKIQINNLNCDSKDRPIESMLWSSAKASSTFLKEYATFRNDPQIDTVAAINTNIEKAFATEKTTVCEHWLSLTKVRIQTLEKAWSGR